MLIKEGNTSLFITSINNNSHLINNQTTIESNYLNNVSTIIQNQFDEDSSSMFLTLRYYARHFIPIFCLVGIVGNCMALLLIRLVFLNY